MKIESKTITSSAANETTIDDSKDVNQLDEKENLNKKSDQHEPQSQNLTIQQIIQKSLGPQKKKARKHQMVGYNQIALITKMLHHQKEKLGVKLSGDFILEKQIEKSNIKQLQQYIKYEYEIANTNEVQQNQFLTLKKKIRRIEQEEKVMTEQPAQIFQEVQAKIQG